MILQDCMKTRGCIESDSYADIHGEKLGPEAVMTYFILYVWDWTHYVTVYQDDFLRPEKN